MIDDVFADLMLQGNWTVVSEYPFMCLLSKSLKRLPSGLFPEETRPRLYVIHHSNEMDRTTFKRIDWEIAGTLDPARFSKFAERLKIERRRLMDEYRPEQAIVPTN
jgi:hypothetical protein